MTEQELRQAVRLRYSGRCGYCGVHESEVGAELELDHFQPRAAGGSDDIDNLVYCCPAVVPHGTVDGILCRRWDVLRHPNDALAWQLGRPMPGQAPRTRPEPRRIVVPRGERTPAVPLQDASTVPCGATCPACNRNKGDFWPRHDPDAAVRRLLHPQHDPYSEHFHEAADGSLLPLSETGLFHIDRLRLNRAPLIARRLRWQRLAQAERATAMAREEVMQLRQRIGELEQAIDTLQSLLERLIRP